MFGYLQKIIFKIEILLIFKDIINVWCWKRFFTLPAVCTCV